VELTFTPHIHSWHGGELSTEASLYLPFSLDLCYFQAIDLWLWYLLNFHEGAITTCSLYTENDALLMFAATFFSWKGERKVPCSS